MRNPLRGHALVADCECPPVIWIARVKLGNGSGISDDRKIFPSRIRTASDFKIENSRLADVRYTAHSRLTSDIARGRRRARNRHADRQRHVEAERNAKFDLPLGGCDPGEQSHRLDDDGDPELIAHGFNWWRRSTSALVQPQMSEIISLCPASGNREDESCARSILRR